MSTTRPRTTVPRATGVARATGAARASRAAGFTVMELLIVLAIVGGLLYIAVSGIRRVRRSDLRNDTNKVAAALRIACNRATQSGQHHRVVFDLDSQTFLVEVCPGEMKLRKQKREELGLDEDDPILDSSALSELQQASSAAAAVQLADDGLGGTAGDVKCVPMTNRAGDLLKVSKPQQIRTWNDIRIKQVDVQHLYDPVTEGPVTVNFFPLGYSEKAVVELTDGDASDGTFRILVHSSGRIEYRDGDWRAADQHMMRDGIGKRVEDDR